MTECIIMATTKGEDDNHHHAYGNHPTTKHQQHKNNSHPTDHSSINTLPLTTTLEEKKIDSPQDDNKMTAWTVTTSSNNNCDDEDHKRNDNNANHHHLHHHHHHVTFPQEKPPSSTTTTTTPTTSSSTSDCIVHRVHLASTASQEDDWVTEKSLTASAADRLGKKHRNAHHSRQQQTLSSHHPNDTRQSSESVCATTCATTTTTEEHFSTSDQIGFYGAYAKVRQTLDYSYHVHYRKERQWLHDAIIEDNLLKHQQAQDASQAQAQQSQPQDANRSDSSTTSSSTMSDYHQGTPVLLPRNPCLIFMVGVHGAAKHSTVRQLLDQQRLRLLSLVCVDTDDLRRYLPEYATYRQSCPSSVDQRTRKEAGYISECLTMAALQAGRNVIYYGSLKDVRWYCDKFIPTLKQQFPCGRLKTALIHVTSDVDAAFGRAQQRARATGRILDEAEFRTELQETIPKACQQLRPVVDYYAELRNNNRNGNHQSSGGGGRCGGGGPELPRNMPDNNNNNNNNTGGGDDLELLTDDGDWTEFTKAFDQRGSILSLSRPNSNHRKQNNNNINNQEHPLQRPLLQRMPPTPVVHTHHRRVSSIRRISACATSEENHLADDMEFYGAFAAFRASLDYTFHKNYTFERQHFQDAIIREFLFSGPTANTNSTNTTTETNTTNTRPWAVFTAGAMGAGKGYAIEYLVQQGRFPLRGGVVKVNADAIRRYLPEYHLYIETNPDLAGDLTNKEAGYIAEILALAGLKAGRNILVDGSLRCAAWYRQYFSKLRREFPGLRLAIIHVTAPREAIFERAAKRALATGRVVPQSLIALTIEEVPKSVAELAPLVDYHVELSNDPEASQEIEIVTPGETWDHFTAQWVQEQDHGDDVGS